MVTKVTCGIVPDAHLALTAPRPIRCLERLIGGPVSSALHPGDLALRMPRAQVLVVGAAYSDGGRPSPVGAVRLAVARGESMLIDKRLEIVGDRRGPARPSGIGGAQLVDAAAPYVRMPLIYERAFGGVGFARNPVGTGAIAEEDGQASLPNLHYANGRIAQDPAGFGPISSLWPARRELLASTSRQAADNDLEAHLSDDFSDAYFLSAPADQQLDAWLGGEMLVLFHLHPRVQTLRMYVPRWVASAVLQTQRGVRVPIPLRLDTILLEPESMTAELSFRADIRVDDEALKGARVAATIGEGKIELPDLAGRADGVPAGGVARGDVRASVAPEAPRRSRDATLVLDEPTAAVLDPATKEPRRARAGTMLIESSPPPAPAPAAQPPAEPPPRARAHVGTMIIEAPDGPPAKATPFIVEETDDPPATQAMPRPDARWHVASTMGIEPGGAAPTSLPFDKRQRGDKRSDAPMAPIPGAPWAPAGHDHQRPKPTYPGLNSTMGLDDDTAVDDRTGAVLVEPPAFAPPPLAPPQAAQALPQQASPPPAAVSVVAPKVEEKKPRGAVWREDPPEAPAAPPPPPNLPRARVSFKSHLYRKLKK